MYNKRVKLFVICLLLLLIAFLLRLGQMQLQSDSFYREKIAELKLREGRQWQFKTVRGRILDRTGRVLAADEPEFQLHIDYELVSLMDPRVTRAKLLRAAENPARTDLLSKTQDEIQAGLDLLKQIIERCARFGIQHVEVQNRIETANNRIWNLRTFLAWVRSDPDPKILAKYGNNVKAIPLSEAIASFEEKFPSENERLLRISRVRDIADMDKTWPLLELKNNEEIFAAQVEFLDANGVQILPDARRAYPYGSVAAQIIGWVGRAQERDKERFENDRLASYLSDEVCGREGIEYVCEEVLRGRRGEVVYDIDKQLVRRTRTEFGEDISLTLDIELQKEIEDHLADCEKNPNCKRPTAAVVIEVASGDILALVSTPVFDLNRARYDYEDIVAHPNEPFRNRAIYKQYPPGSVIKPLILIAGLESGKITPLEVISCPAKKAPEGWPSCWLFNKYKWLGHDDKWQNHARNAIRGSCNIYFSRLADRIDPDVLQQWFFRFGYGREFPLPPASFFAYHRSRNRTLSANNTARNLRQAPGIVSSGTSQRNIQPRERRFFGIGQGNLRVTPLQVANAMAAIARGGVYKLPRLCIEDPNGPGFGGVSLSISPRTLAVLRDGMSAVVNESGGTAYNEFRNTRFAQQGVEVFGKTGSTEEPENAWFAGFAEDTAGRGVAVAVLVEQGERGSSDAAPLAAHIFQFCIDRGYIGNTQPTL